MPLLTLRTPNLQNGEIKYLERTRVNQGRNLSVRQ